MNGLQDKIVLVTGGSSGLGRALAAAFVREGSRVVVAARNQDRLMTTARELSGLGRPVLAVPCDVTDKKQVEALDGTIRAQLGALQILINNAGIARAIRFLDMPDILWQEILSTNLTGTYYCCKVFLPAMLEAQWGRIINIASTTAKVGYPYVAAYAASKHGVLGLTRSLALETARHGITVNAVCPGYLNNDLTLDNARRMAEATTKSVDEVLALFAASAPQNRLIEPEEVASLAVLLAHERSAGITGQAINVDGGAVMV
jgi:NAD(P)-dependent dehydrogenase (short-subunit alcohol dehydrogenase family)